jgi:CubicO group peptidase (beta-lactamase class C family)
VKKRSPKREVKLDQLLHELREKAEALSFSGVISIFHAEEELYNEAFGFADRANARRNTTATKFGIASGTKLFTALGIGKLIDQGRVALETPVRDIFQRDLSWIASNATIGQLLTHTSGIFDHYDEELITDFDNFFIDIPWYRLETPTDYLPLLEGKPAKFLPGERFCYSNGGYLFLGIIIETITAQRYRDFLETAVFAPANMSDSGFYAFNDLPENTANGYKHNGETNIYNLPIRGASDGGAFTTTYDLRNFWTALLNYQLLSKELTTLFLSSQITIEDSLAYGYGIYLSQLGKMKTLFIVGGDAGVGFDSLYIPEQKLLVNILANTTNGEEDMRAIIHEGLAKIL